MKTHVNDVEDGKRTYFFLTLPIGCSLHIRDGREREEQRKKKTRMIDRARHEVGGPSTARHIEHGVNAGLTNK